MALISFLLFLREWFLGALAAVGTQIPFPREKALPRVAWGVLGRRRLSGSSMPLPSAPFLSPLAPSFLKSDFSYILK